MKKNQTRGDSTDKNITNDGKESKTLLGFLDVPLPLVLKKCEYTNRISNCNTATEYFATTRDFRATNPTDEEVAQLYRIAPLKLAVIKGGGNHLQEEIDRRLNETAGQSPGTVATAPLSLHQARALKRKYEATGDLWDRFWFWIGKQVEGGADAAFIEESEKSLALACNEPNQQP
ncbi:MAG: hypothetical protein IT343_01695 [Candidatus Melainabacteria bacterium]|nr:hypothetical protein [Candidatus Melainabacteria bacterium]